MSSGRYSLLGEVEKMSGFYINFYFKNIEYNDGFCGGEFSSHNSDVYCEFLYDRKKRRGSSTSGTWPVIIKMITGHRRSPSF